MYKILQISVEINSGSVGRIAAQIGEKILDYGWESYITFARNSLPTSSKVIRIGSNLDVYLHVLQTRVFDSHGFGSKNATKNLVDEIEEINPDLIHLHHLHGYYINIQILFEYLVKRNKPIVWTFHDCWSFTGHCAYFDHVGCNKWMEGCYDCEQKGEYPTSLLFDRSTANYLAKKMIFNSVKDMVVVSPSNWLGHLVKSSFLGNYPMKVIQNGIDLSDFSPQSSCGKIRQQYKINAKFVILGVASVWEHRKGLRYFIELAKLLPIDAVIVIVGLSKKQNKDLPKSIIGIERTESVKDLAKLYSMADVFVNTTLEDTFPTTNLEALACGTPVITFNTGGSVESVSHETGLVTPKGDLDSLLGAVNSIRQKTKQHYSKSCRQRAIALYDKNLQFQAYIDLYEKMLAVN